ncbi:MAG: hypothetical protein QME96_07130 [Myxococcota bacterium]|nr:hypothetical protein [Myxococcota bacterium]
MHDAFDRFLNGTDDADEEARSCMRIVEGFNDDPLPCSDADLRALLELLHKAVALAAEPDPPTVLPLKLLVRGLRTVPAKGRRMGYQRIAIACIALDAAPDDKTNRGRYCLVKMTARVRKLINRR